MPLCYSAFHEQWRKNPKRQFPIGIQAFRKIRDAGSHYAGKTPHIERLIEQGAHYFLSRPQRCITIAPRGK